MAQPIDKGATMTSKPFMRVLVVPLPSEFCDGHGLARVEFSARRDGDVDELARSQVVEDGFRVVH